MSESSAKAAVLDRIAANDNLRDFTIVCGSQNFRVHRLVLEAHPEVFKVAVSGPFVELSQRTIDLTDYSLSAVSALLEYLYEFDYDSENIIANSFEPDEQSDEEYLLLHVNTAILADKYAITDLQRVASDKFEDWTQALAQDIDLLSTVVKAAYAAPSALQAIRKMIVDVAVSHRANFLAVGSLEKTLEEVPQFAIDFAKAMVHK